MGALVHVVCSSVLLFGSASLLCAKACESRLAFALTRLEVPSQNRVRVPPECVEGCGKKRRSSSDQQAGECSGANISIQMPGKFGTHK